MSAKMLNPAHEKTSHGNGVISARRAADYLGLAHNTFFKALDSGIIHPQAKIEGDPRPAYGFETAYLDEVKAVIPRKEERVDGQAVFTYEIRSKIEGINRKWKKRRKGS